MQIVADRGMDLMPAQMMGLDNIHQVPLLINLDGKTYRSGVDIQPREFYDLLANTESFPTTAQPSAGDFAELYREIAQTDPDILSVHISSGLSGTINAAREGAKLVPEANITVFDSLTLSGAYGWQVEAAARAAKLGWSFDAITPVLERIRDATETVFTLDDLKYLIHGGRIGHIKGLLASVLRIRPVIGVGLDGRYEQRGQARTIKRALKTLVNQVEKFHKPGAPIRVQVLHALNPVDADAVKLDLTGRFQCDFLPVGTIAPVLGAHTGPTMVGIAFAAQSIFEGLPWEQSPA